MTFAETCEANIEQAIELYRLASIGVLVAALFVWFVYRCCLKEHLEGAPGFHAQYFLVAGCFHIGLGALLWASFLPYCSQGCDCQAHRLSLLPIYPVIFLVAGMCYLGSGIMYLEVARNLTGGDPLNDPDSSVFASLPTDDVELERDLDLVE